MKKRLLSLILAIILVATLLPVTALGATITNINDSRINEALSLIDQQNFNGSGTSASAAKDVIRHFISGSSFAAIGGGKFPYPNSGSYTYSVSDGTYTRSITGAKGCMAYCNYLEKCVYGRKGSRRGEGYYTADSLKNLLRKYGQAGEHIRIDNTHSLTFISCDDNGFYCFSYNGDSNPYIKLQYRTYSSVISNYSGKKLWIYDDNTNENNTHTHSWTTTTQNDANTHNKVCSCGAVIGQEAHSYGSWITSTAATHTTNGSKYRTCSTCGYRQTETIPATGHSYSTAWKFDGTNHWHECSCGDKKDVKAHQYSSIVTKPTTTQKGYTTYTCTVCGCSYRDHYTAKLLAAPTITLSNVASSGKIKISWKAVEGATKYEVYRATSKTGTYSLLTTTTSTSVTNTKNSTPGKTYYYKVRALGSASAATSAYSEVKSRTCDYARPAVSVTLSSGKPKLSWKAVDGATKYEIYRATSKSGTYSLMKTTISVAVTDIGAKKGTTYYYKVRAIGSVSAATSAYSTVVSIKATK